MKEGELTGKEKHVLGELKKEKQDRYEVEKESERQEILKSYEKMEGAYNDYVEKKIDTRELCRVLGNASMGAETYHPGVRIYAYELLIKSLSETDNKDDIDRVVGEVLYSTAISTARFDKEFFLGILNYYTQQERQAKREEDIEADPHNQKLKEEVDVFQKMLASIARFRSSKELSSEEREIADLIGSDFSSNKEDGELAGLVAEYYAKEPHATRPQDPYRTRLVKDVRDAESASPIGTGVPELVYVLGKDQGHTSAEKIREAKAYGIKLFTEIVNYKPEEKVGLLYDLNPEESLQYITSIREALDVGNLAGAERLHNTYRRTIWDRLDDHTKQALGHESELIIRPQTIRDTYDDTEKRAA